MKYLLIERRSGREVVTETENNVAAASARGFTLVSTTEARSGKYPELAGQPTFRELAGPMWGGEGIVRYEDWAANRVYST